jgi:hypothetical protein
VTAARDSQTTSTVLMVRPARFQSNPETAATNAFQRGDPMEVGDVGDAGVLARARAEFDGLVAALREHGVEVLVVEDSSEPEKPDAVFPNNWITFHADGSVVLYPLLAPSRRHEVRPEILGELASRGSIGPRRVLDLRAGAEGFLEGTGSLVLDRVARVAYACRSPRTSPELLARFCAELGSTAHVFDATDARGLAIYHTNVMLSVGTRVAVACLESVRDRAQRVALARSLASGGRELVTLTLAQMEEFAGNLIELRGGDGEALVVRSARARRALRADQVATLERHGRLVSAELATIEHHGGGSARCMIAEVF